MHFAYYSYHMTDAAMLTSARCSKCGYMPQQDASGQICHSYQMSFFLFLLPVFQTSVLARYLPPPCTHSICKDTGFSLFLYFFLCQCCVFRFALLA